MWLFDKPDAPLPTYTVESLQNALLQISIQYIFLGKRKRVFEQRQLTQVQEFTSVSLFRPAIFSGVYICQLSLSRKDSLHILI